MSGRGFRGDAFVDGDNNIYHVDFEGTVYVRKDGHMVYLGDLSEETLDRLRGANARWYGSGLLYSYDQPNTIVIHHTQLGTDFDAANLKDIAEVLDYDYNSAIVKLNIIDRVGIEYDADCLLIHMHPEDNYADVAAKIRYRLEHHNTHEGGNN